MESYFPTKYDSARDEVVALLADEATGYGRASTGNVDCCGWHGLVILDDSCDLDFSDTSTNYPAGDEVGEVARTYGVTADEVKGAYIVTHNSQGFVYVVRYTTTAEAKRAFADLESAHAEHGDDSGNAAIALLAAFPILAAFAYVIGALIGMTR